FDRAFPIADKRALARISNPRLPFGYFQVLHRALENLEAVGTLIVSHLGELEHPDLVPEIADLLVRMETRTWSFVSGAWQDRVYLSLRTTNPRGDAGRLMRRLVGRHGKGGGHGMLAGGWVPVTAGSRSGAAADIHRRLARRVATALRKDPDRLAP